MHRLFLPLLLIFAEFRCVAAESVDAVALADSLVSGVAGIEASGNGPGVVNLKIANKSQAALGVVVPAGTVFAAAGTGLRQVTLRSLKTTIPAGGSADAVLPAAVLSLAGMSVGERVLLPGAPERKLAALIALFDKQPDLPRATAQLAVLVVMEDVTWPVWSRTLTKHDAAGNSPAPGVGKGPTPAQVAQAVDSLALVRLAVPELKPSLLMDDNFKRLALRNPWARGKAMVLYGLTVEDAVTGDPSLPPDLGKLLHTAPNDNCAICRQRGAPPEFP